jgi:hypothetical protein
MKLLKASEIEVVTAAARRWDLEALSASPLWARLDFMQGAVGAAYFAAAAGPLTSDAALVEAALGRAVELFNAHGAGPGLHSGVAGLGLFTSSHFDLPPLLEALDEALLTKVSSPDCAISLRSGLAGFALYAAARTGSASAERLRRAVSVRLAELAIERGDAVTWVVPTEYARGRGLTILGEPVLEMGVAHGHAGVLVGLSALAKVGDDIAAQLLAPALEWVWRTQGAAPNRYGRALFGWDAEHGTFELYENSWCTGDTGVARAAWLAAGVLGHRGHIERALRLARQLADELLAGRPFGLADRPNLCCGAAAVGHIFHRFYAELREPKFREVALAALGPLVAALPSFTDASFQFGELGVLGALIAASGDHPSHWDTVLGVTLPW